MPIVFVHGVATRQSPTYQAWVQQRDQLFKILLPTGKVFNPDWGSNAVNVGDPKVWLPVYGETEALSGGAAAGPSNTRISALAHRTPTKAIDLAFEATLDARLKAATGAGSALLDAKELAAFKAAVDYLDGDPDRQVFDPNWSDTEFLTELSVQLGPQLPPPEGEAMGLDDAARWLRRGLKSLVDPVSNAASDTILRLVRPSLSEQVALFLGDIFVYLRWRETDGAAGTANRIFEPIAEDLRSAIALRRDDDPLIVVAHSLGGVILYDMLSDQGVADRIGTPAAPLKIDAFLTVGSQPGLFAEMGLYDRAGTSGARPRPRPASVDNWLNIYDFTDTLSFKCNGIFEDVDDLEFDNVTGLFNAHTSYFQRPSFYQRVRKRLKARGVL